MKSVSLKQRLAGKKSLKKQWMQKESVSKQGRKPAKAEPSVHKDPLFDELADDTLDYMDTENAQDMGRSRFVVHEEKEREEKEVSTEDVVSTDKEKVSTDRSKVSTDRSRVSTDKEEVSTDRPDEGTDDQTEGRSATPTTQTPTLTTFGDDETIAQVLLNMSQAKAVSREKEKGVELKDVEETERPRPTSTRSLLTLKPLPKIDPKDKGKKKKGTRSLEQKKNSKKLAEEEAIKASLSNEMIKEMNEDKKNPESRRSLKKRVVEENPKKEDTAKVPAKVDMTEQSKWELQTNQLSIGVDSRDQQDWEIVTWRLYESCGAYILELKDGTVIHMLVERRYPFSKDLLQRMLDLGLEVERESTAALDLIRFIKQQIGEE
ncbi:hypothetical protein Tco_0236585 [Tanacetum coccineum]